MVCGCVLSQLVQILTNYRNDCVVCGCVLSQLVQILTNYHNGCVVCGCVLSQLVQILTNYRNGSTGQLSAVTIVMLFGGALARIFTSIQETGDATVIATYVVTFIVNTVLLGQIVYYWNSPTPATAQPSNKSK